MLFFARQAKQVSISQGFFLRWVRAQGHNQDTPSGSKNASSTVGIPLKRGTLGARR